MRSERDTAAAPITGGAEESAHVPALITRPAPAATAVLTRAQCAAWLAISPRQLARLDVPCVKLGRLVRYCVPAVLRWLEEGGRHGAGK
jgi:hypothetical protein